MASIATPESVFMEGRSDAIVSGLPLIGLRDTDVGAAEYFAASTIDGRGRVADRTLLRLMGWEPGASVTITPLPQAGVVLVCHKGPHTVTRQGHLRLPASVRHRCRMRGGDRLLILAHPDHDVLVVYLPVAVAAMTVAYDARIAAKGIA